jgi:acylglycerol lipase
MVKNMKHEENYFEGQKGTKLFYQKWLPDKPKAVIELLPGFAEHSSRYSNVVNTLVPAGYAIYGMDHRGHGKSEGLKVYADSFDQMVEDAKIYFDLIKKENPNLPIFMLGHSMGCTIAIYFLDKYESLLKGAILSGIGTFIGGDINGFLRMMSTILSKIAPKLLLTTGDLSQFLSHDPKVIDAFRSDPLIVQAKGTARIGHEFMKAIGSYQKFSGNIKIPTLIVAGAEDKLITGNKKAVTYFNMPDKTVKIYDGLYHEIFNEPPEMRKIPLDDLKNWLDNHL